MRVYFFFCCFIPSILLTVFTSIDIHCSDIFEKKKQKIITDIENHFFSELKQQGDNLFYSILNEEHASEIKLHYEEITKKKLLCKNCIQKTTHDLIQNLLHPLLVNYIKSNNISQNDTDANYALNTYLDNIKTNFHCLFIYKDRINTKNVKLTDNKNINILTYNDARTSISNSLINITKSAIQNTIQYGRICNDILADDIHSLSICFSWINKNLDNIKIPINQKKGTIKKKLPNIQSSIFVGCIFLLCISGYFNIKQYRDSKTQLSQFKNFK